MSLNNRLKGEDDMYAIIILKEGQKIGLCYAYMNCDFNKQKSKICSKWMPPDPENFPFCITFHFKKCLMALILNEYILIMPSIYQHL
jgi:hypothetical protein